MFCFQLVTSNFYKSFYQEINLKVTIILNNLQTNIFKKFFNLFLCRSNGSQQTRLWKNSKLSSHLLLWSAQIWNASSVDKLHLYNNSFFWCPVKSENKVPLHVSFKAVLTQQPVVICHIWFWCTESTTLQQQKWKF